MTTASTPRPHSIPPLQPLVWKDDQVQLIDQTRLPQDHIWVTIRSAGEMADAIVNMLVRGAPAIGIAAAYGIVLGAQQIAASLDEATPEPQASETLLQQLALVAAQLRATRPTAVNLFWAIDRMMATAQQAQQAQQEAQSSGAAVPAITAALLATAQALHAEDLQTCQAIGDHGLAALPQTPHALRILTHCNTGSLATAGYGTALGVVRSAWRDGRLERVYADETRPRLQGAKLTAWECVQEGIPVTVITDSMAAHCMKLGMVDAVIVGADRITRNGDTANKIGTYSLAIIARAHGIPFFVAAPLSTVDFSLSDGSLIPIEERNPQEIYQVGNTLISPQQASFYNPAFDVTPANLIAAIITEKGAIAPQDLHTLDPALQPVK